jgi:hypothetical protein
MKKALIIVGVLFVICLAGGGCQLAPSSHRVLYVIRTVQGTWLDANVTYINSSGGTQQEKFYGEDDHADEPHQQFAKEYEMEVTKASGDPVYISAQIVPEALADDGFTAANDIHVEILVDGKLVQEASSQGEYCVATASGIVQ